MVRVQWRTRHRIPTIRRLLVREFLEVVLTAEMFQVRVQHDEVGREHGGCDFVAVSAVADEAAYEAWCLQRLRVKDCVSISVRSLLFSWGLGKGKKGDMGIWRRVLRIATARRRSNKSRSRPCRWTSRRLRGLLLGTFPGGLRVCISLLSPLYLFQQTKNCSDV